MSPQFSAVHLNSRIENSVSMVDSPLLPEQDQATIKYFLKFSPESKTKPLYCKVKKCQHPTANDILMASKILM